MDALQTIRIDIVESRRNDVLQALAPYIDTTVGDVDGMTTAVKQKLPAGTSLDAVFESVRYVAGTVLTHEEATALAWRLAGNVDVLKAGHQVSRWVVQRSDEWVPLQVIRLSKGYDQKKRFGSHVSLQVLAGTPAGLVIRTFWTPNLTRFVAYTVGFSKPHLSYPFADARDLVGLRLYGKVEAARSRSRPEFHEIACPAGLQKWNRDNVLRLRLRVGGMRCQLNFTHPCRQCAIGADRCKAATHPLTYTVGTCSRCGRPDQLFDPDDQITNACLGCPGQATQPQP